MSMETIYDYDREQVNKCNSCGATGLMEKTSIDMKNDVELWTCECGHEEVY